MADVSNGVASTEPRKSLKDRVAERKALAAGAAPAAAVVAVAPAAQVASAPAAVAAVAATTTACGAISVLFPGCLCTLVPHEGDHESKAATGGTIHWSHDGVTFGLGASQNWKPIVAAAPAASSAAITSAAITSAAAASAPTAASVVASFVPSATVAAVLPPDAPPRTSTPEEVAAASAPRRGRKPKEAAAPATAPVLAAASAAAPTATSVTTVTTPTAIATPAAVVGVCPLKELYVDCLPVKPAGAVYTLGEEIMQWLSEAAAKAANVPDWRFVEFGKGKGAMAVILRERLATMPEILVVSSSTPGSDVLIEVLSPHAKRVVRALRG